MYSHVFDSLLFIGRAGDRHAQLDIELKGLQMSLRELESFLKWLQEAETTVNVLADASQREDLSQDSAHVKELRRQLEVRAVKTQRVCVCVFVGNLCTGGSLLSQCHPSLTHPSPKKVRQGCVYVGASTCKMLV